MCLDGYQVGISILKVLLQITRPKIVMLGNIPGSDIFRNIHQYKEAVKIPGFLVLSIEAPINFANITYLNDRLVFSSEYFDTTDVKSSEFLTQIHISFNIKANITCIYERISRWIEDCEAEDETQKYSALGFVILDLSGKFVILTLQHFRPGLQI